MAATDPVPEQVPESESDRKRILLAMTGICAVVVLIAFDLTIVGNILPRVASELGGMALYAWVGTAYLLSSAVFIPIFGRLGDLFGRKPFILVSVVIMALGSLLCGLAQSMEQLIAFRALQGLGGGMITATAFTAPVDLFPDPKRRIKWQALISTSFATASGLGPILGGALTDLFGWRAAFFITPLTAVLAFVILWRFLPRVRPQFSRPPTIDWLGGALLVVMVGSFMAGLELGMAADGQWALALACFVLCGLSGFLLVTVEKRVRMPMLPLRVFATREIRFLNVVALLVGWVMFFLLYYGPLLFQTEMGLSPSETGLALAPMVAMISVGSIINGRLFGRMQQPQFLMVVGCLLAMAGVLLIYFLADRMAVSGLMLIYSLCGLGFGFLVPNLTLFAQILASQRDAGTASALIQTLRSLGSALGTTLIGMLVARSSVKAGIEFGLLLAALLCGLMLVLAWQVRMRQLPA